MFEIGSSRISSSAVLDPTHPGVRPQPGHWLEYPSYLFVHEAGCYVIRTSVINGGVEKPMWAVRVAIGLHP